MKSIFPTGLILYKVGCDLLMNHVSPSSWTFLNSGLSISSCEPQLTPSSCEPGSWAAVYRYQNMCLCHIYNMLHAFVLSFRYIIRLSCDWDLQSQQLSLQHQPGKYLILFNFLFNFYLQKVDWFMWALVHGQSSWLMSLESWAVTVNTHDLAHTPPDHGQP